MNGFDDEDTQTNDPELEKEFEAACATAQAEIKVHMDAARAAVNLAVAAAEKHGVPFRAGISPLSNTYNPRSLKEKFGKLDREAVNDISGTWNEYPGESGWQHSAVC